MSIQRRRIGSNELPLLPRCRMGCLDTAIDSPAWAIAAESRWGLCGEAVEVDGRIVGYLLVSPPWHAGAALSRTPGESASGGGKPGSGAHGPDALLVALWCDPASAGRALPQRLVEYVSADLLAAGDAVLDADATRFRPTCRQPGVRTLQHCGFVVSSDHPIMPTMRLDLRRSVRDQHWTTTAWRRLVSIVRPGLPPSTAQLQADEADSGRLG